MEVNEVNEILLEGNPMQVSEQIIQKVIGPIYDKIHADSCEHAHQFAFSMAGMAASCFLNTIHEDDIDSAKETLKAAIDGLVEEIKQSRVAVTPC